MQLYGISALLALLIIAPSAAQTSDTAPRVQGCFSHGEAFCRKRCHENTICINECKLQCATPEEFREERKQQAKDQH
jgi:hypothetical protein